MATQLEAQMVRPRVFIASADPRLNIAGALQLRLERDFHVTVWDQGAFRPSRYPLPSLLQASKDNDFAIQIVAPDVVQKDKGGDEFYAPNANVLIETGIFLGALGQERVFLVSPRSHTKMRLPSDLQGLTLVTYDDARLDNLEAAMGGAAHKLSLEIARQWPMVRSSAQRWYEVELFKSIDFGPLVAEATELTCYFIHSRRWRENVGDVIEHRMESGNLQTLHVYLPDIRKERFIRSLAARFDDEPTIPAMIYNAVQWVENFAKRFGERRVKLSFYAKIPAYSFYRFQSTAVIAFYTLARKRRPVPSVFYKRDDAIDNFVKADLIEHDRECGEIPLNKIEVYAELYKKRFGINQGRA